VTSQLRTTVPVAGIDPATACAEIDLAALRSNVTALRAHAGVPVMVVVKADGYGHGILECAREARAAGAEWLGVATPIEALMLREAGDSGPLLAWLYGMDEDLTPLVAADVDVSAQSVEQIGRLVSAAAAAERHARVHLKIDTGLSRNGAPAYDWQRVCAAAAEAEHAGALEVVGIWSHFAAAD
jgi:alanine racemase